MSIEAIKQMVAALEDLRDDTWGGERGCQFEWETDYPLQCEALKAGLKAIEEAEMQEQGEPVAWRGYNWGHSPDDWVYRDFDDPILDGNGNNVGQPLYTTPQQRKPLITEAMLDEFLEDYEMIGESEDGREACYAPNENDKALIKDAVFGLLHFADEAAHGIAPQAKPLNDCEVCNHKVSNPDGGHCYMFRKEPEFKCANFDLAMPKCEPQPTLYVKDIDGNFHEYAHEIKG